MKKNQKKKRKSFRLFMIFLSTLCGVLVIGIGSILMIRFFTEEEENAPTLAQGNISTGREKIPDQGGDGIREEIPAQEDEKKGKYTDILADPEYMKENNIYPIENGGAEISLGFGGDILFDPGYSVMAKMLQRTNGIYDSISAELLAEMNAVDVMMLNNEFPYSNGGTPTPEKQFTFRAKPESAEILKDMGVDIVSLANNHAYDFGETAFIDSLETLETQNIPYVGAGRNLSEAVRPVYFMTDDLKIGIVSATQIERLDNPDTKGATEVSPGVFRCWNPDKLLEVIRQTKENCDFVVVYIHWGTENTQVLDWAQLDQAPKIVEAGADLVIGDHPHCLQEIQYINGVPVMFSLGNFWFNSKQVDTCLMKAVVDEEGLQSFQFIPAMQKDSQTFLLEGAEKERVLSYMRGISGGVDIDGEGFVFAR